MTKTYCDVCKQEMDTNWAGRKLRLWQGNQTDGITLIAFVEFQKKYPTHHLCRNCAENLVRKGNIDDFAQ